MVRVNFRAHIKHIFLYTMCGILSLSTIRVESKRHTQKTLINKTKKHQIIAKPETAFANLQEITLESSGKQDGTGKKAYDCMAKIKKLNSNLDQESVLDNIELTCTIFDSNLSATIENILLSPYRSNEDMQTYYMLDATAAKMKFADIEFSAQTITVDTKTKELMLHECTGIYHSPYKILGTLHFITSEPIKIKNMILFGRNIHITAHDFNTHIQELEVNYQEEGRAKNITTCMKDFVIFIEKIYIKNSGKTINSKSIEKIIANNIKCTRNKTGENLEIISSIAYIEKNKLILPKPISINTDKVSLVAQNGYQEGTKIFLKRIKFKTASATGYSDAGYFDIKNKELILENGKIEW